MAFQIDMSPLERSSMGIGQSLASAGQNIGQSMLRSQQEQKQQDSEEQVQALLQQAMSGDPQAFQQLMTKSPQAAQMVAQQLQAQQKAGIDEQDRFKGQMAEDTASFIEQMHLAPPEQQEAMFNDAINNERIDVDEEDRNSFMDVNARKAIIGRVKGKEYADSFFGGGDKKGFTLSEGQKRYDAKGNVIASVSPKKAVSEQQAEIPQVLLEGLSGDLAVKASAAYSAAGGGKDGMQAYQKQVDKGTEQEKRSASPQILKANFPQASPAEMSQLQGAMDAAKTTETGLVAAGKVRTEQKRLVKAKGFQERAITLLDNILSSEDLGDVTGSLEGAYDFRPFSDDESSLIADIEEAGNILTADNLSLMSGVLSESDIKILKNLAGGGLIRTRSEARFKKDVQMLKDKLSTAMVSTIDERSAPKASKKYIVEEVTE